MKLRPKLCIGMSVAPTWLSGEGWRQPDSGIEGLYGIELAVEVARRAEAAHMDFVFRPDASYLPLPVMAQSFGFSSLDPTLLLTAILHQTSRIGLLTTISTTFEHPYTVARQLMSLHWLSKGRAGWNVVTALHGNENFGMAEMPSADLRYARAAEFTEVVQRLWGSFPPEALLVDRPAGHYADTDLILPINHIGPQFQVKGPLNTPQFPGDRIPLMQAGGSKQGINLAGKIADMVFGLTPDFDTALAMRKSLSQAALAHRRRPQDIRLMPGLSLYLGRTRAEATDLFRDTHARVDREQRLARLLEGVGLDLTGWPEDRPVTLQDVPVDQPHRRPKQAALRRLLAEGPLGVDALLARPEILASLHWQVIGTVEDALAEIRHWFEAGAVDGFIAVPGGSRQSLDLMLDELLPRLVEEGLFRDRYSGDSFLHHLQEGLDPA